MGGSIARAPTHSGHRTNTHHSGHHTMGPGQPLTSPPPERPQKGLQDRPVISAALLCPCAPTPRTLPSSPSLCLATCSSQGQLLPGLSGPNGPYGLMRSPDPQALGWKQVLDVSPNFRKPHRGQEARSAWSPQTVAPT